MSAPGLSWKAIDEQFFGAQPGIPDYVEQPGDIRPDLTEQLEQTFGWVFSITDVDQLDRLNDHKARTIDLRASRPDFSSMSDLELWEYAEALFPFHRELFQEHIYVTTLTTVPVGVIQTVATLLAGLTSSCRSSPVSARSTRPNRATQCGSCHDSIQRAMNLHRGLSNSVSTLAAADPTNGKRGRQLGTPTPTLPLRRSTACVSQEKKPTLEPISSSASERAEAAETLLSMVEADPATHGQLAAAIAASGAWLPARERTKTNNIRLIQEIRVPLRELGRRYVERQVFDEIEDFGLVLNEEMEEVFGPTPEGLTERVRERRSTHSQLAEREPEFVFADSPSDPSSWPKRNDVEVEPLDAGDSIQGFPGCPGVSEGVARVVLDSSDPTALGRGDVLVAPSTDPSWTPLFVPAGGVVVDVGAALSHAIIVSRARHSVRGLGHKRNSTNSRWRESSG